MINKLLTLCAICVIASSCRLITAPATAVLGLPTLLSGGLAASINRDGREGYEIETFKIVFNDGKQSYRKYIHVYGRKSGGGYKSLGFYGDTAAFAISDNQIAKFEYTDQGRFFAVKQLTISSAGRPNICYRQPVQTYWIGEGLFSKSSDLFTTTHKPETLKLPTNYKIDVVFTTSGSKGKFVNLAEMNKILKKQGIPPLKPETGND